MFIPLEKFLCTCFSTMRISMIILSVVSIIQMIEATTDKELQTIPAPIHKTAAVQNPHKNYLYKILVVGDIGGGKTSIIKRYVNNIFSIHCRSTIGVDFALKVIEWDANTSIRLQLWDISGQERFGNMTRVYYKEAVGAFVVFDILDKNALQNAKKWKTDIDSKVMISGETIPVILLANKIDLAPNTPNNISNTPNNISNIPNNTDTDPWKKTSTEIEQFCTDNGFIAWFSTSAKENINIENAVKILVTTILERSLIEGEAILRNMSPKKAQQIFPKDEIIHIASSPKSTLYPVKSGCCLQW